MAKFIVTQHIGDRHIDDVIEARRQKEKRLRTNDGTLMHVYRSSTNPRVIAFTFGRVLLEESVRLAFNLSLYRSDIIVGRIPLRVVA